MVYSDALRGRSTRQAMGIAINAPGQGGPAVMYIGTKAVEEMIGGFGGIFTPGLTSVSDIFEDGAPGVPSLNTEIRFSIANKVLAELVSGAEEAADSIHRVWWNGASVAAYHFIWWNNAWENNLVFYGEIRDTAIDTEEITIRATNYEQERRVFPVKQVLKESMLYGTTEGVRPDGAAAAPAPLFWGRFHTAALGTAWDSYLPKVPWAGEQGEVLAPALGIRIPMIPLPILADKFQARSDAGPLTDGRYLLYALGDLSIVGGLTQQKILLRKNYLGNTFYSQTWPFFPEGDNATFGASVSGCPAPWNFQVFLSRLFTWDKTADVAVPFAKDLTADQVPAEAPFGSCGDWYDQFGEGSHTAAFLGNQYQVQTPYVQRLAPDWGGTPPGAAQPWTGTVQSIFLQAEQLTQQATVTDTIQYGTTAGVVNPLLALTRDMTEFATIPGAGGNILSVQLPHSGPNLGEVIMLRVGVMCSSGPSRDVRISYRAAPGLKSNILADWHTTQAVAPLVPGTQIKLDPAHATLYDNWGSGTIFVRGGSAYGHGVPQWSFIEFDGTIAPGNDFAGDVAIWPADGLDIDVYAVWLEAVFRPNNLSALSKRYWDDADRYVQDLLPGATEGWIGTRSLFATHHWERRFVPYTGNLPNQELKNIASHQLYMTGVGPADSSRYACGDTTGVAILERPPQIAIQVLDKFGDAYAEVEQGVGAFGSFVNANQLLELHAGGTIAPWTDLFRLSVLVKERISVRAFLDKLGENSMCFFRRQATGTTYKWRCFVDTSIPATDAPERLWRSGNEVITANDCESITARLTGTDLIRNHFTLRYGYHEPTKTFAYEKTLTANDSDLTTDTAAYVAAADASQTRYAPASSRVIQEEIIELPWVWSDEVSDLMLKYHADLKMNRRVVVEIQGFSQLADLVVGQFVQLDADIINVLGPYPGLIGSGWSGRWFSVVSRGFAFDGLAAPSVQLVEVYSKAA